MTVSSLMIKNSPSKPDKAMKKTLIFSGLMLAAAFTLTNCVKETVIPAADVQEGVPFTINVGTGTKTAVSPTAGAASIEWTKDDILSLFVAETDGEYSNNRKFTTTEDDAAAGRFIGTLPSKQDEDKTYEYKVVYPWKSGFKLVNASGNGTYLPFGSQSTGTQTQEGNNNPGHLAGSDMPLYGVAKQVKGGATPQIEMHQAMAVVKVHVTNKSNSPLTVTSVAFSAPEGADIIGTFYVDFSGDEPTYTSSGAGYTSNTASLAVTNGAEIANNESADFYIGVLPFTLAVGSKLGVTINGTDIESKAATAETVFAAGKIKTVNVNYEGSSVVYSTVAEVMSGGVGSYNMQNLLVYAANTQNAIVGDSTGKMLLYIKDGHGFEAGDNISIIGATITSYNGLLEITGGNMTKNSFGNVVEHGEPLDLNVLANAQTMPTTDGGYSPKFVTMKGLQSGKSITGANLVLYLNANNDDTNNKNVIVTGYAYSYSTKYLNHSFHAVSIVENTNTLEVSPTSLSWMATETDAKEIGVTLNAGASGFTVNPKTHDDWDIVVEDASVTVSPKAANTSTEAAKSITLTIAHADDGSLTKTVTCTQAKATSGDFTPFNVWEDDFSQCKSSSTALTSLSGSTTGFTGSYSDISTTYTMDGAIRVGKASGAGSITTPVLSSISGKSATLTVTFDAAGWKGKTAKITLSVNKGTVTEGQTTIASEDSMSGSTPSMTGTSYTFNITGADATTAVTFTTTNSIGIDNLVITQTAN